MNNLHSHRAGWGVLIVLCVLAAAGCAQPVATIDDMSSFEASQDQTAAGYYRAEAVALKEKAAWHAESAVCGTK